MSLRKDAFTLGVTGHLDLSYFDEQTLRSQIRTVLLRYHAEHGSCRLMSNMACGADTLFAEEALLAGISLVCTLPFANYREILSLDQCILFNSLVSRAAQVIVVAEGQERERAYWLAGKYNADNCDALLAIWDGEPQSSACGTEAVVTYARSIGKETVIFS